MATIVRSNAEANEIGALVPEKGFKNYIINGVFDIWQRGTTASGNDGWYYLADRFKSLGLSDGERLADGRLHLSSTNDDTGHAVSQVIEKVSSLLGKVVTFSADVEWVSGADAYMQVVWRNSDGDWINSYSERLHSLMSVGDRKIISITLTVPNDTDIFYLDCRFNNPTDAQGLELKTINWQLEEGEVATPFEHRPYGLELSLCQRYYEVGTGFIQSLSDVDNYNASRYFFNFKSTKRIQPSVTTSETTGLDVFLDSVAFHDDDLDIGEYKNFTWTADAEL